MFIKAVIQKFFKSIFLNSRSNGHIVLRIDFRKMWQKWVKIHLEYVKTFYFYKILLFN